MNFTTSVPILKSNAAIDYNSKIISLGSCFAENMGEKFDYFKFQNTTNPFGIIFNPVSIEKLVNRIVSKVAFTENDIFFYNEQWHCFEIHSVLSNANKAEFLRHINEILKDSYFKIAEATHIIVTYGTSWIYRNIENNEIVANCHKIPQKQFSKEILSIETIEKSIQRTIEFIQKVNANCHFIFTISPVRHIKDGFVENQQSKAHLITALHAILKAEQFLLNVEYFSSYEIMMDELRDYRFYAQDMLHPSQVAIDFIWEKFIASSLNEHAFATMDEVKNIQKSLAHKPFNLNSESHQKFTSKLKISMELLQQKFPFIRF